MNNIVLTYFPHSQLIGRFFELTRLDGSFADLRHLSAVAYYGALLLRYIQPYLTSPYRRCHTKVGIGIALEECVVWWLPPPWTRAPPSSSLSSLLGNRWYAKPGLSYDGWRGSDNYIVTSPS